jgi:phytoene dehydrogenase-like protein
MEAIPRQLARSLPEKRIHTGARVQSVSDRQVVLNTGERIKTSAVVLATPGPETARLLGDEKPRVSRGELCLHFSAKDPPGAEPYLYLNGDENGCINSLTFPSLVAPTYAPAGQTLVSVVVLGPLPPDNRIVEEGVRRELTEWFGRSVAAWRHLQTDRIVHALPDQSPPLPDPTRGHASEKSGIYVCGEYDSVPGIQWALLSGRYAAEKIIRALD